MQGGGDSVGVGVFFRDQEPLPGFVDEYNQVAFFFGFSRVISHKAPTFENKFFSKKITLFFTFGCCWSPSAFCPQISYSVLGVASDFF